jgi:hypothetical protein
MAKKTMAGIAAALAVLATSCMTNRLGYAYFDTPSVIKNINTVYDVILPYIASVLDYNDPDGTNDPNAAAAFRKIPVVNNMNYDNVVNCQDYALLFYAMCQYYKIPCNLVGNPTLGHAYNQMFGAGGLRAFDIEPQDGESQVYYFAPMRTYTITEGITIWGSHPDNIVMDIAEWNRLGNAGPLVSPANMDIFNYVVANGKLP